MLKANLKIVSVENAVILSTLFLICKNPLAHLQYIRKKYAWFQDDPLKTIRRVDYTNSIPYNAKNLPKMTKFNML